MLVTKKTRLAVYKYLFQEGVLVAKKDMRPQTIHPRVPGDVINLEVVNLMRSFKSRGYVRETFAWQYLYWFLTNEGIEYLREYLHLPPETVPNTMKRVGGPAGGVRGGAPREFGARREGEWRGDRTDGYRGRGGEEKKAAGEEGGFRPEFRGGGFGRGTGAPPA